jgi:methionine biosynthesis protein MetW
MVLSEGKVKMLKSFLRCILPSPVYKLLGRIKWETLLIFGYKNMKAISPDYDEYWQDKKEGYVKKSRLIQGLIQKGSSVLDIGCGDGTTLELLLKSGSVSRVMGVDISQWAVKSCKEKGIEAIRGDITNSSFVQKLPVFDYIVLADTIEHLYAPEELLVALKVKFKKGIILTFPNTGFLRYRLRLLFGKFPMQWRIFHGEHLRFWTLRDFRWWVDELGFRIEKFVPIFGIPFLKKIWPNLFCSGLLFLIKQK